MERYENSSFLNENFPDRFFAVDEIDWNVFPSGIRSTTWKCRTIAKKSEHLICFACLTFQQ